MDSKLQGKTLGIMEPALCGFSGHWYEWIKSVKLINEAAGVEVRIAGNRSLDPEMGRILAAEPVFTRNIWEELNQPSHAARRYGKIVTHNFQLYRECLRLLNRWGTMDCVMSPVVTIHHLLAWLVLTRRYGGVRFKRLVMQINIPEGRYENGSSQPVFKRSSGLIKRVIQAYQPYVEKGIVCFGSDSDQTAKDYELLTGVPFVEFPTPRVIPPAARRPGRSAHDPVVFCCLGPSRHEKGADLFLDAIRDYLRVADKPRAKFVLQWTGDFVDTAGKKISPDPWLLQHPDVKIIRGSLSSEEYEREMLASDCLVLPYRWSSYFCRISGLAVEAATAGIPVIYTAGTWLERAMKKYGAGISFPDGDVPRLLDRLQEMAGRIDHFRAAAESRVITARNINSSENFLKHLWGLASI